MAIQPVDRKNAKHHFNVAPRKAPSMVNRSNKRVFAELAPLHVKMSGRITVAADRSWMDYYCRDWWK